MNLDSSQKNKGESKVNKTPTRASKAIDAAMYVAAGASLAGVIGDVTKNDVPQRPAAEIASESIDHRLAEKEAGTLVFMLNEVFRAGGSHVQRNAEMTLLRYLETGIVQDVSQAVARYASPDDERKQAIARLGEAVLALSRFTNNGEQIDNRVGELLARVSRQFSEGMKALAEQRPNPTTPFAPSTPSEGHSAEYGSDAYVDDPDKLDI